MPDPADLARQLHERVRRRVLRRVLRTDAKLSRLFDRLGARLRRRFRLIGMTDDEVARAIEEEFQRVEDELLPDVERDLAHAAQQGDAAARQTLERLRAPLEVGAPFSLAPESRSHLTLVRPQQRGSGGSSPETA